MQLKLFVVFATISSFASLLDAQANGHPFFLWCRFFTPKTLPNYCTICGGCPQITTPAPSPTPNWNTWTQCTRTCEGGTRYRIPKCPANNNSCPKVYQDCNEIQCPTKACTAGMEPRYHTKSECCTTKRQHGCGYSEPLVGRVLGGSPAKAGQWPWMVRLEIQIRPGQISLCGGSLLNEDWLVTAAHCFPSVTSDKITAILAFGTLEEKRVGVKTLEIHPTYNFPANDIALLQLKTKVAKYTKYVKPICLPRKEETAVDKTCYVAGWGSTQRAPATAATNLQEGKVRKLPFDICNAAYKSDPRVAHAIDENRIICAGRVSGGVDTCLGDSGGPLMCQRCSACNWYLAGVTSTGPPICGTPQRPGVYTKVLFFEAWIISFVKLAASGPFSC